MCKMWFFLVLLLTNTLFCICIYQQVDQRVANQCNGGNSNQAQQMSYTLTDPDFWPTFVHEVEAKKSWKCSFPRDILWQNIETDAKLYSDDTVLKTRRTIIERWRQNETEWATVIVGACKELASNESGVFVQELEKYRLATALRDFVDHLQYFQEVADLMEIRGEKVEVASPHNSRIHDIDKLDPVMLAAYSERFEDNCSTSLWDVCVKRHTLSQPHHQAHCLWHNCCNTTDEQQCWETGKIALREMVCDKVSRRLQKNFNGIQTIEMWDADIGFYSGLPKIWLAQAANLMSSLKNWKGNETDI